MNRPVARAGKQLFLHGRHAADCASEEIAETFEMLLNDRATIEPTRSLEQGLLIIVAIVAAFLIGLILGA